MAAQKRWEISFRFVIIDSFGIGGGRGFFEGVLYLGSAICDIVSHKWLRYDFRVVDLGAVL